MREPREKVRVHRDVYLTQHRVREQAVLRQILPVGGRRRIQEAHALGERREHLFFYLIVRPLVIDNPNALFHTLTPP